jgi:hypothetical protein
MGEPKRRIAHLGVTVVAGLISCAIIITPTAEATAQPKQAIPAAGPDLSSAVDSAFHEDFSKPLDATLFTQAYGRMEIDTAPQMGRPQFTNVQLVWDGPAGTAPASTSPAPTSPVPAYRAPAANASPATSNTPELAFSEDFKTPASYKERFDYGWSGEWNAGSMFREERNDWHADHGMMCENPNNSHRTIHLTSQQQASEAAFYYCMPDGNPDKGHLMTSVNTAGFVTVWFSPKQIFHNVSKVCWDQNITNLGGGKWTIVNFLTAAEYAGKTDLGYTSSDFPKNGGPSSPQGPAANGVKVFHGVMHSYTSGEFREGARGVTVSDKATRYRHCVIDNGNGTLTTTIAQPNGRTVGRIVAGNIPDGDIRVQFGEDSYNPDKHFDGKGAAPNSTGLYTWHWDNIQIYTDRRQ